MLKVDNLRELKKWIKDNPTARIIPSMPDNYVYTLLSKKLPIWKGMENKRFVMRGFSFEI